MPFDEQAAIEEFWNARARGEYFPPQWFDKLTLDQAYRIQLGMQKRLRQPVANGTTGHERGNGSLHPLRGTRRMPRRRAAKSRSAKRSAEH